MTIALNHLRRPLSRVTSQTLEQIRPGALPVRSFHAVGCWPLQYRTFGGNPQGRELSEETMDQVFGDNYLLTLLTSSVVIRHRLYPQEASVHSLYCDGMLYRYLDSHGLIEAGVWDRVDGQTLDRHIRFDNVDHRIYYSICKPFAIGEELRRSEEAAASSGEAPLPVLFVDADLILKKSHDQLLKHPQTIRAAFGHLETIHTPCYPDFRSLHFPEGYQLPERYPTDLPAVNTCLMYFNDFALAREWSDLFAGLMMHNQLDTAPDALTISQQLLGFDQRTFPMIAAAHGLWGKGNDYYSKGQLEAFVDLEWNGETFLKLREETRQWHYYTLEHHPQAENWLQDITHTWINKRDIERDLPYKLYQGCIMLEMLLYLQPNLESCLRSVKSLEPYFELLDTGLSIEALISQGKLRSKLDKTL